MREALAPWTTGTRLLNFCDGRVEVASGYGESWARLREVTAAVDPDGLFQANHAIR